MTDNTRAQTHRLVIAFVLATLMAAGAAYAQDGTYGTGNCNVIQKILSRMTGVWCGYL